ncbi:hypothetical protein F522_09300 [Enterococcus hirae 81-15-F4]|nr:hypothetical protein F522_09300 [Enterococcus hirae 81-15-F4]
MFFPPLSFADIYLNKKKVFVHAFFSFFKKSANNYFLSYGIARIFNSNEPVKDILPFTLKTSKQHAKSHSIRKFAGESQK